MDNKEMVAQIAAMVAAKLAQAGETVTVDQIMQAMSMMEETDQRPGLLVLTQDHGCDCHALLESERLQAKFRTCCALLQENQVELDDIDTVVLFHLTIEDMCKIVSGITDTPYTKLAAKALLSGKKLYVPKEEVELYQYPVGGLGSYQCMLQAKLTKLISWGLKICPREELEDCILGVNPSAETEEANTSCCDQETPEETLTDGLAANEVQQEAQESCEPVCETVPEEKEISFSKRVITERDIIEANRDNVKVIHITERNILTALARDAASARNIRLIRE